MSRSSESENASRIASRMAKETIQVEISKEIVEKAVEDGLASASGTVIFTFYRRNLSLILTFLSFKSTIEGFET